MALDNSYNSWADQWDSKSEYVDPQSKKTVKDKVGDGLGKTKSVALTGIKKVKQGTSIGFHWIKEKFKIMGLDNSYNSWADQWDTEPEYYDGYPGSKAGHGKSKAVAATGMQKVKKGTTFGFHWIKEKYHKTTHK
ncbi:hypothetical protein LXL04_031390 [Taraxacum kok-saghyz]